MFAFQCNIDVSQARHSCISLYKRVYFLTSLPPSCITIKVLLHLAQNNKVMIITGASSGFGEVTARMAARQGYRLVVTARREDRLKTLVDEITAAGGQARVVVGDITQTDVQRQVIDAAIDGYGGIDVLVNNAGVPLVGGFIDESLDNLRRQWETNVLAMVILTRLALPELMRTRGVVINIGSVAGHFSLPGWGMYFPTKVAVASLSDALRRELQPRGVRVCLVEPGPYQTEFYTKTGSATPIGLPPEQVARTILRLAARPGRLAIVPFWMGPFVVLGGFLNSALPELADVVFWIMAKLQDRRQKAGREMPDTRRET